MESNYTMACLDTGSFISLISHQLWSDIPNTQRGPIQTILYTVTSVTRESIDIVGLASLSLHLGNRSVQHQFLSARNISHSLILGWDFFWQHQASISSVTATFDMPGTSIPLADEAATTPLRCNALLVDRVTIPSMCEINVQAQIFSQHGVTPDGYEGMFEPQIREHLSAAAARSLCTVQN